MSADTRGIRERAEALFVKVADIEPEQAKYFDDEIGEIVKFAESELAAEREACAQIADDYHSRGTVGSPTAKVIAASIRARQEGS